jgi:hypothetical protein
MNKYNMGIFRVPLDQIGTHPLNRHGLPVSGKHVHHLMRTILENHGFARYRYDHPILLEVAPGKLAELREHNEHFTSLDPLLPPASKTMKYGAVTKNHLIHGIKCFANGTVRWDDTKEAMRLPGGPSQLKDHIDNGVWAMVLKCEALDEDLDGVKAVMVSSNLEQAVAMPEHEVELLHRIHMESKALSVQGKSHWDVVKATLMPLMGTKWGDG